MGIRDREISRIVKYAAGLGIRILFKKYDPRTKTEAEWSMDGTEITVFMWSRKSKTATILDLVHELAHHMAWIHDGKVTPMKIVNAHEASSNWDRRGPPISKEHRKTVYESEMRDARFQDKVFKELQLEISEWRFQATRKLDMWIYKRFWYEGKMPTNKRIKAKRRELHRKYRSKHEASHGS